jgi:hypothetical protein
MQNSTIKRILFFNGLIIVVSALIYFAHFKLIDLDLWKVSFSLFSVYLFFGVCAMVIVTGIELLFDFIPSSAAYGFLVGVFLKMGLFMIIFFAKEMSENTLNFTEKLGILVPLFLFLSIESAAVISRLKHTN